MGSATRQALVASRSALAELGRSLPLTENGLRVGEELFAAGVVIEDSKQLRRLLADPSLAAARKKAVVTSAFGSQLSDGVTGLLASVAAARWSEPGDLLSGIEELGLRAVAESAGADTDVESELFAFGAAVASDPALELAVGSKLGDAQAKVSLVEKLLAGKASEQTVAIVRHLVRQPRGRRIGPLLRHAASIVADQANLRVATITTAAPLAAAQLSRLQGRLSAAYGRQLLVNQVVDPAVLGGVRVQIGDDIIDGSVISKLNDLRLQLAS
jgi:F-type H+-transporting ATPase subunit delta